MDSRLFLLRAYQVKQHLDDSPGREAQAVYLLLTVIIAAILYAILTPLYNFEKPLPVLDYLKAFLDSRERKSEWSVTPGAFPDDQAFHSIMDESEYVNIEKPSPVRSLRALNTDSNNSGVEPENLQDDLHILLQQELDLVKAELDAAKVQVEKAKMYVLLHLDARTREQATAEKLQTTEMELEKKKQQLNGQYCVLQHGAVQEFERIKRKLEETEDRVAQLLGQEVDLTEKAESLQRELNKVSNKLKNAQSANVECSTRVADLEKQFRHDRPISQAQIDQDNFALGTTMRQYKAEYDESLKQRDEQLEENNQKFESLYTVYLAQGAELAELRANIDYTDEERIREHQATIHERDQTIQQQSAQLTQLHDAHNAIALELAAAKSAMKKTKEEGKMINLQRNASQNRMEQMRRHMQSEIDSMRNSNLNQQALIRRLEIEGDDRSIRLEQAQHQIGHLETQLSDRMDADPQSKEKYEQEIKQLNINIQQMNFELNNLKALSDAPGAALQRTVTELQCKIRKECIERKTVQVRFEDNLKKLVEARKEVEQLRRVNGSSLSRQTPPKHVTTALQAKLNEQEVVLKQQGHTIETQQDRITNLESTIASQSTTVTSLNDQLSTLTTVNSNLQYQVTHHETEAETHKSTIAALESHLESQANHILGIQSAFETTRQMHQSQIADLQARLNQVRGADDIGVGATATATTNRPTARKRDLDTHFGDDDDVEVSTRNNEGGDQLTPISAPASTPLPLPASKRRAKATDKSDLDFELFEGPIPDMEAWVKQDEERARRESEAETMIETMDE